MIVRDFNEIIKSDRNRVSSDAQWSSVRMLLSDDGLGFFFQITFLEPGSEHTFENKDHVESVYCMQGVGSVTDLGTGTTHQIKPGVMYALDKGDRHTVYAEEELVMACCFTSPTSSAEPSKDSAPSTPAPELQSA